MIFLNNLATPRIEGSCLRTALFATFLQVISALVIQNQVLNEPYFASLTSRELVNSNDPSFTLTITNSTLRCSSQPLSISYFSNLIYEQASFQKTLFTISNSNSVVVANSQFVNCYFSDKGGIFNLVNTSAIFTNVSFQGNGAYYGGTIYAQNSNLSIDNCSFTSNSAYQGASIYQVDQGNVVIGGVQITSQYAADKGGFLVSILKNQPISNDQTSSINIVGNFDLLYTYSKNEGAFIFIDNTLASINITQARIKQSFSQMENGRALGEVIQIINSRQLIIQSSEINLSKSLALSSGPIIFVQAQTQTVEVKISNSNFSIYQDYGQINFNSDCFQSNILSLFQSSPFVQSQNSIVQSFGNTFRNNRLSKSSAVFQLTNSSLQESSSIFQSLSSNQSALISCSGCRSISQQIASLSYVKSCQSRATLIELVDQQSNFTLANLIAPISPPTKLQYLVSLSQTSFQAIYFTIQNVTLQDTDQASLFETGLLDFQYGSFIKGLIINGLLSQKQEYLSTLVNAAALNQIDVSDVTFSFKKQMKSAKLFEKETGIFNITGFQNASLKNLSIQCSDFRASEGEQVAGVLINGTTLNPQYNPLLRLDGNSFNQPFNLCPAGITNVADCQINQVLMEAVTVRNCYNFQNGVVVQCRNCQNLVVRNSNFSYISKDSNFYQGQPSGFFQLDEGSRYLLIKNSTFKNIVTEGGTITEIYQKFGNITVQDSIFAEIYSTKKNGGLFRSPQGQGQAQFTNVDNRTYWRQFVRPVFLYLLNSDFRNISSKMHGTIVFQIPQFLRAINFNDSVFVNVTTQQSGAILYQGGKDYYTSSFQNSTLKQVFAFRGSAIDIEHVTEGFDINNTRIECFSPELDLVRSPLTKKAQFPFIPGPVIRTKFWREPIRIINSTVTNCISFQIGGVLSCGYYDGIPTKTTLQQCVYGQNSTFVNNSAYFGGVVATKHGDVNFQNSTFINNTAYQGGAIAISICYRFSNMSSIIGINNSAIISGGFLYSLNNYSHSAMTQPQISIQKSYFENHYAKYGALIGNEYAKIGFFLQYSQVKNSIASQYGGVLYGFNLLYFYFLSTDFYDCNAKKGVLFYGTGDWYNPYYNYLEKLNLDCQFKSVGSLVTVRDLRFLWFELINFQNCVFSKGNSMFEIDYNSGSYIFDAVLQNNVADFATILKGTQITVVIYTSTMRNNTAWRAGVMSAFFQSSINSYTVTYSNNRAIEKGGVIYTSGNVSSLMSSCTIFNNTADEGSVGYYLKASLPRVITFDNTKVYNNSANFSTIVVRDLPLVLRRSQFYDNYHFKDSSTVNALMANITLSQASFWNSQRQVYGQRLLYYRGFLQSEFAGNFSVLNSTFINGSSSRGGAIYMISGGRLDMNNSIFLNNYASDFGGSIFCKDTKAFTIRNNSFRDNLAFAQGDDIYAERSYAPLRLNDSHFATSQGQQQVYFKSLFARLTNITFRNYDNTNNYKQKDGGALQCIDCNQLIMNTTYFYNLSGRNGGALYIQESQVNILQKTLSQSSSSRFYTNLIINTTFSNCSGINGGAIYLDNAQNTSFINSTFQNNSAQSISSYQGKGGAVFITTNAQSNNTRCAFDFNTTFTRNNASTSGGAIFWESQEPFIQQNDSVKKIHKARQEDVFQMMFKNNSALAYGNDVASGIQQINFIDESVYYQMTSESNFTQRRRAYEIEEISQTTQFYKKLRSGQQLERIFAAVSDIYGQIIANDQSTVLRIITNQSFNDGNDLAQRYDPVLQGINTFTVSNGVIMIDDFIFFSSPGFNHSIELSTDAIDTSSESSADMREILNSNDLNQKIIIELRNCEQGEQFTFAGKCQIWITRHLL